MLDVFIFVGFLIVAIRIATTIFRQSAIYDEFKQPKTLAILVLLFPVGPVALLALPFRVGWLPAAIIAAACYLPAMISSRLRVSAFECSGTDRTSAALRSAHEAFGAALVGLIYVSIFVVLSAATSKIVGPSY